MKFSKKLQERAHPKYREHYIAYKELKKAIRLITGKDTSTFTIKEVTSNFGSTRALSGAEYQSAESRFQSILNEELQKINQFTRGVIAEWYGDARGCLDRLDRVEEQHGVGKQHEAEEPPPPELPQIGEKLKELGQTLQFLESYRIVNFRGFTKITKKFDKHNEEVVSSSFYISVVLRSFFMSYDVNLLVCILSLCYKRYRGVRSLALEEELSTGGSTLHRLAATEKSLPQGETPSRETHPKGTSTPNLEGKAPKGSPPRGEPHASPSPTSPNERAQPPVEGENPKKASNHTKYIVKAQDLMSAKIEISKYYSFHWYHLKEDELMPPLEKFLELISASKIQNDLTTIYFDDCTLSRYHSCVNRSSHHGRSSHSVRLRCYSYVDAQKECTKTVFQHFNVYEPSCDPNEKYIFAKEVPQEDLKITCVDDLYGVKKKRGSSSGSHSTQGADSTHVQHYQKCIREIERHKLSSCLKSRWNRIHFGDDNVSGYIDENICYWVHTDKGAIHGCEEVDSVEGDHSDLDQLEEAERIDSPPSGGNLKTRSDEEGTAITKGRRKYAYFDYAVIDISVKDPSSGDFSVQLSNLGVAKEIWGFSPYVQGISMLYPHRISTAPHWRIFTHPEWAKGRKKRVRKMQKGEIVVGGGRSKGGALQKQNEKHKGETPQGRNSNQSAFPQEDVDSDLSSSENTTEYPERGENPRSGKKDERKKGITYTGASARIAHESEVMFRNEVERNKPASARHINLHIDSAGSGDYRNNGGSYIRGARSGDSSSDWKRSHQREKQLTIGQTRVGQSLVGQTRVGQSLVGQTRVGQTLLGDNNLYEPLLDPLEETTPSKGKKSPSCRITSFFKKIFFCENKIVERKRPKTAVVRVEPKTFFANERTLLQWLNTSVLLSTISITLLNFSNSYGFASGVIMAPVAIFFILYSFHIYLKRAEALINKEPINYTDKVGPGVLVITLTFALSTVVLLNIYSRLKGEV
ncbi:hypothetical protein PVBG_00338 [Plasmodium vivax Brazil I]|uniref:SPX domain-containing protein n=1 Tax=Plasmodium vivax (strain Brazil I) TaxID=1033975 RepID=A0A0J9VDU9_PLAV1|nr:hypothetical protein PVBG_00338 [Plasmodium vivax Brazil I]